MTVGNYNNCPIISNLVMIQSAFRIAPLIFLLVATGEISTITTNNTFGVGPKEGNGYLVLLCLLYLMMILEICALQETHEIIRKSIAPIQLGPLNFFKCNL